MGNEKEKEKELTIEELKEKVCESYRYHTLCARSTLFPGKSIEEVEKIIEKNLRDIKKI